MSAADRNSRLAGQTRLAHDRLSTADIITITERPATVVQLTSRRGRQPALASLVGRRLHLNLPQPNYSVNDGTHTLIWIQPLGWLLLAPAEDSTALSAELKSALVGIAAVVDQSHGKCILHVSGLRAREVLARCCRLDFHPRCFGVDCCAMTLVSHVPCVVLQADSTPSFDLIVASTSAKWLLDELKEASRGFGSRFMPANAVAPRLAPP
ncbi:sarcosine oxidase subunit gamma [Bradyrhizobium genosp. SA-3]|uniref:sarcosine oxidase subunit gamma n=1 Tax=Bradyrhizobium genosp. SA-3 TaxID=508868 RepID=UPI0026BCC4C6